MAEETRPCPKCGQQIQVQAVLCRFCKATLGEAPAQAVSAPPPKKSSMATCLIIGACVAGGGIVLLGVLAALLLPAVTKAVSRAKVTACANNLRQLWVLQTNYMSQFGGRTKDMPDETGEAFWLKLTQTQPRLIDASEMEVLQCPLRETPGTCDYRGPGRNVKFSKLEDPVGADKPGNHGPQAGGNVLRKDGSIVEVELNDPLWDVSASQLRP